MESANVTLSDRHKQKIKSSLKKGIPVSIQLSIDQLTKGNDKIFLTKRQFNKLQKHKKNEKGIRLEFSYKQLQEMKNGGFLNEILEFAEEHVPYVKKATPFVRKTITPAIKDHVLPWIVDIINKELDKVIKKGEGLQEYKDRLLKKISNH